MKTKQDEMSCRTGCGACCIIPSISSPYFGMPHGKPPGTPCVHLSEEMECMLFGDPRRPKFCDAFAPELMVCGEEREQALLNLTSMEIDSTPGGFILRSVS